MRSNTLDYSVTMGILGGEIARERQRDTLLR